MLIQNRVKIIVVQHSKSFIVSVIMIMIQLALLIRTGKQAQTFVSEVILAVIAQRVEVIDKRISMVKQRRVVIALTSRVSTIGQKV